MNKTLTAAICALGLFLAFPAGVLAQDRSQVVQPVAAKRHLVFSGKIYNSAAVPVIPAYAGTVVQRFRNLGDVVAKNDPLVEIRLEPQQVVDIKRKLNIDSAVRKAELDITRTQLELKGLEDRLSTLERLVRDGMAPERDIQTTRDQIALTEQALTVARKSLTQLRADQAEQVKLLRDQFGKPVSAGNVPSTIIVRAPAAGTVLKVSPLAEAGLRVPQEELFSVGSMNPMRIRTQAFESDVVRVKVGEEAEVIIESLDDRRSTAKLESISLTPTSSQFEAPSYYLLEFSIDNSDNSLREGYKVRITFR
jgi:multidrug resistance efflux pump